MSPEKELLNHAAQNQGLDWWVLWHYAAAAVVGGAGGCAMAGILRAKGFKVDRWIVLSYAAFGTFSSIFVTAIIVMNDWRELNIETVIVYGGGIALALAALLSGVNFTLHWSSKKFLQRQTQELGLKIERDEA